MEEQNQASALLIEMIEVAAKRGVFSRIEINAIQQALDLIRKPVVGQLEKVE